MQFVGIISLFFLVLISRSYVLQASQSWTYVATDSSCDGSNSNPCGPVRSNALIIRSLLNFLIYLQEYWFKTPGNEHCGGSTQSPINIGQVVVNTSLPFPMFFEGSGCHSWFQFSNNYTFEVSFQEDGQSLCSEATMNYDGSTYQLLQIHFHSPSEHTFSGGYYSGEAHLVHENIITKSRLVVAVLLQVSATNIQTTNNTLLQTLWSHGGPLGGLIEQSDNSTLLPYSWLIPSRQSFYTYNGSLTTPPCKPNVPWIVFDKPAIISQSDIDLLRSYAAYYKTNILSIYGNNNRFPQPPLNDRIVYYVPSEGECVNNPTMNSAIDDDNDEGELSQELLSAIVLASIAIAFAFIGFCGSIQTGQRLNRIEVMLENMSSPRKIEIEMTDNPAKKRGPLYEM
jgi:carbonic anhydrase